MLRPIAVEHGWSPEKVNKGGLRNAVQSLSVSASPNILFVDLSESADPLNDINSLAEVCEPGTIVIAAGTVNDVRLYRDLVASGIHDYLLKPFSELRFKTACERALDRLKAQPQAVQEHRSHVFIKSGHDLVRIDLHKLLFIQAADNYLIFHEPGRQTVGRMTLTSIQERLPATTFIRIHHSYIVSLSHVEKLEDGMMLIGRYRLPVSLKYKKEVLSRFK